MSLEQVGQCPVCKENKFQPFLICKDFTSSGESFHLEKCATCGLVLTNPRPTRESASSYYHSANYISHKSAASDFIGLIYLILRRFTVKWKYKLIAPYLKQNLLLDFGCGAGSFLEYCKQKDVNTFGVEPSAEARAIATKQNTVIVESIERLPDIKFNVITLWHVLEHVYNLEETIDELKGRLAENGIIFIAVPNWQSPDSDHYKEMWAGYDVPRHVWHFSKTTMTRFLENNGLKVKQILPMKLDAYYVSLLSEKYKANQRLSLSSILKAISNGYRSNSKTSDEKNNSSLIYLAQK